MRAVVIFSSLKTVGHSAWLYAVAAMSTGLVCQWERGENLPRGASLKLLTLVAKNDLDAVA